MSQSTKDHILQTASSMMSDAPSSSISLRDFAETAGVSKALLLKYFGSRSNFLIQVLEHERLKIEDMWSDVDGNTSVEDLCLRLLTAFQINPRYFKLVTRLTLENTDPDVQRWLKERFIYGRIQKVVERLQSATNQDRQFRHWSPEAFGGRGCFREVREADRSKNCTNLFRIQLHGTESCHKSKKITTEKATTTVGH